MSNEASRNYPVSILLRAAIIFVSNPIVYSNMNKVKFISFLSDLNKPIRRKHYRLHLYYDRVVFARLFEIQSHNSVFQINSVHVKLL